MHLSLGAESSDCVYKVQFICNAVPFLSCFMCVGVVMQYQFLLVQKGSVANAGSVQSTVSQGVVYIKSHRSFQPPVSKVKVYMVSVCLLELGPSFALAALSATEQHTYDSSFG